MNSYSRVNFFKSRKKLRFLVGGIAVLAGLYLFFGGDSGLYQIIRQTRHRQDLEEEIRQEEARLRANEEERRRLKKKDPALIEKKAREDLGMVKKGEQVYIISHEGEEK